MKLKFISFLLPALIVFITHTTAQKPLQERFQQIASNISGKVGVSALLIETGEQVSLNGNMHFPMQSVYKFPIAMAMLAQVDKGVFRLDSIIKVDSTEYIPDNGHSPIRDENPGGARLTVRQLIQANVESDGTACDVLLRLLGGTKAADRYIKRLGINDMQIATTEMVQVANDTIQYQNWSTPNALGKLFSVFLQKKVLSPACRDLLIQFSSVSNPWFDRRIKAMLPVGTKVFHKTGTSGTFNGLTRATNDAGVVTLPDGKHLAISVFIADSYATQPEREVIIAKLARAAYDYFTTSKSKRK